MEHGLLGGLFNKGVPSWITGSSNSWVLSTATKPTATYWHGCALANGRIYCAQGYANSVNLGILDVYDPETNTWETKTGTGNKFCHCTQSVISDGRYIHCLAYTYHKVYDTINDTWSNATIMPTNRYNLVAEMVGSKIYAIGGKDPNGSRQNINECYDKTTGTWTTKTARPINDEMMISEVVGDSIYVMGGNSYSSSNTYYNYETDTWTTLANLSYSRLESTSGCIDGKIYIVGGYPSNSVHICYDTSTNTCTTKTSIPSGRTAASSVVYNNLLFVIGGTPSSETSDSSSATNTVYVYIP